MIMTKPTSQSRSVYLIANGDLRLSANQKCWKAQKQMEKTLIRALRREGWDVQRGHFYDPTKKHGFIDSQKMGMEVFRQMDPKVPQSMAPWGVYFGAT